MAAHYIPGSYKGDDVLELYTTDNGNTYRARISSDVCSPNVPQSEKCAARIETTSEIFVKLITGEMNPLTALMRGKVRVKGNLALLKSLPGCFDMSDKGPGESQ